MTAGVAHRLPGGSRVLVGEQPAQHKPGHLIQVFGTAAGPVRDAPGEVIGVITWRLCVGEAKWYRTRTSAPPHRAPE